MPGYVAPLIAPAVDVSVLGLIVGTRHLALHGAAELQLRPARVLLLCTSAATLALNVAGPVAGGRWGSAAFDAVGPLLLIGWSEVGPKLLRAMAAGAPAADDGESCVRPVADPCDDLTRTARPVVVADPTSVLPSSTHDELLERARDADTQHRERYLRPISAERLRKQLRISTARSRALVNTIRYESRTGERSLTGS